MSMLQTSILVRLPPLNSSACPSLLNHQRAAAPRNPTSPLNPHGHTPKSSGLCAVECLLACMLVNTNAEGGVGMVIELGSALLSQPQSQTCGEFRNCLQPQCRRTSCSAHLRASCIWCGSHDRTPAHCWTRRCATSLSIPALVKATMHRWLETASHDGDGSGQCQMTLKEDGPI